MKELIKVTTNDKGQQLVSARELHEFLEVTERFSSWFERYCKYGFEENIDYTGCKVFNTLARQELQDYAMTIEMAKEFSMLQRTEKGKQARKYFIECEKIAKDETNVNKYISEVDIAKSEIELVDIISKTLNLNDVSKLQLMGNVLDNHNINKNLLPVYTESKGTLLSASELLKRNNINISVIKFNKVMIDKGYLVKKERPSTKDSSKIKKYNNLVKTEFGENFVNPKSPKETQPMYYENKFLELLKELGIK